MIILYNILDTRTNQVHSVAVIRESNAKWFVPVETDEQEGEEE